MHYIRNYNERESGKVKIKFLWLPSLIISIVGTILLTVILNVIL